MSRQNALVASIQCRFTHANHWDLFRYVQVTATNTRFFLLI